MSDFLKEPSPIAIKTAPEEYAAWLARQRNWDILINGVDGAVLAQASFSLGGAFSATGYVRKMKGLNGNWVELYVPTMTHSLTSSPASGVDDLPSTYRPAADIYNVYRFDGSRLKNAIVYSTGKIQMFYRDWSGLLSSDTTTSSPVSINYFVPD